MTPRTRVLRLAIGCALVGGLLQAVPGSTGEPARPPAGELGPLVSGTDLMRDRSWAWTDYVYDDRGAAAEPGGGGAVTYPEGQENTADLVQVQVTPAAGATRLTALLQTLRRGDRPLVGVALDLDANARTGAPALPGSWRPSGPLGAELLVSLSAAGAEVHRWSGRSWRAAGRLPVAVQRFQGAGTLSADVPHALADPSRTAAWRLFAVAGRADADWRDVGPIHDLGCVRDVPTLYASKRQGDVLAGTAPSALAACRVDLAGLRRGVTRLPDATTPGYHFYLYRSTLDLGGGTVPSTGTIPGVRFLGAYQPYLVIVPKALPKPAPMIVYIHGAQSNYVGDSGGAPFFLGTQRTFQPEGDEGERHTTPAGQLYSVHPSTDPPGLAPDNFGPGWSPPAIVVQTQSRGESGGHQGRVDYSGIHEADVLEALADVRRRLPVDPGRVVLSGSSMGGIGTFQLAARNPDLFSGAFAIIGEPHDPAELVNLRNVPFRQVNGVFDPLVAQPGPTEGAQRLLELGYDHRYWLLNRRHHETVTPLITCVFEELLAKPRVVNPSHVVYRYAPAGDAVDRRAGLRVVHDRAYWVSGLRVRPGATAGVVDVRSEGFQVRDYTSTRTTTPQENLSGGRDLCGPNDSVRTADTWIDDRVTVTQAPTQPPVRNAAVVSLEGLSQVRFDLRRMRLATDRPLTLEVATDGPVTLRLAGRWAGPVTVTVNGRPAPAQRAAGLLTVPLPKAGAVRVDVRPG